MNIVCLIMCTMMACNFFQIRLYLWAYYRGC